MNSDLLRIILFGAEVVLSVVVLLFYVFKKTKVVFKDTFYEKVLSVLPSLIQRAESLFKVGSDKKSFVLGVAYALLSELTGESVENCAEKYGDRIGAAIENILETPQKKEVD